MKVFGVVYLILNKLNGKMYVGQTVQSLKNRMARHLSGDQYIDRALKKYGLENFYYGVIKSCASKAEMDYWEKFFIAALKTKSPIGYNLTDGGEGTVGIERTPEQRAKLSAALSGERNPRYGKKILLNIKPRSWRRIWVASARRKLAEIFRRLSRAQYFRLHVARISLRQNVLTARSKI